jgi:staphylococcal nuclease domain-containing protein 1
MEKLYEGLVKGTPTGDQVIVSGKVKKNSDDPPEEITIYLSMIQAPKSPSSNNSEEEPFGWDARDFLRQATLGKVVKYTMDYKINEKTFGQIYSENKNVNLDLVKNGLAKVGFIGKHNESMSKSEYYSKLQTIEAEAKKQKLGVWSNDHSHKKGVVSLTDDNYNPNDILSKCKGKEIEGICDFVINCAVYIIYLKDFNTYAKVNLRFVALPSAKDTGIYKAGKVYVERLILHREIKVILHSLDENKNFTADVFDKKGSFANFVVRNGYTKLFIGNNITYTQDELTPLKQAQALSKKEKLRIWKNEKDDDEETGFIVGEKKQASVAKGENVEGVCIQVHSGDSISVKTSKGDVQRIFFANLRAPNLAKPNTNEQDQPWAWQAREFLRKVLVGKKVRCEFESSKENKDSGKAMTFYSIFRVDNDKEKNVGQELIEQGFANFQPPRSDAGGVSPYLDVYITADKLSKDKKQGIFSNKAPGNPNYSDLISSNKTKKKEFSSFLVGQKNLQCVVEYVFAGNKFKLRVEKNKCMIPFSLLGIKTVAKDKNNTELYDRLFNQALDYSTENILQREGTCDIVQADRVGNYFGYLTIGNTNYASTLLKEGLAVVNPSYSAIYINEFKRCEKEAESAKKNIWAYENIANYLKETDTTGQGTTTSLTTDFKEKNEELKVRITDYIDFNNFYVNVVPNKILSKIEDVLSQYDSGKLKGVKIEPPVKKGLLCVAKYKNDDRYYRAVIQKVIKEDKFEVEFIDYGTIDTVYLDDLIKLDSSISVYEAQALLCEFAYLKYSQHSMKKALDTYTDFVNIELTVPARACYTYNKDGKTKTGLVVYRSKDNINSTYHADLISSGFAKLDTKKKIPDSLKGLHDIQKKAEGKGIGIFAENERTDYDEEEEDDMLV